MQYNVTATAIAPPTAAISSRGTLFITAATPEASSPSGEVAEKKPTASPAVQKPRALAFRRAASWGGRVSGSGSRPGHSEAGAQGVQASHGPLLSAGQPLHAVAAVVAFHKGEHTSGTQSPFATDSEVPSAGAMGCLPAGHVSNKEKHEREPTASVIVPGGQGRHAVRPPVPSGANVRSGHLMHAASDSAPATGEYVPPGHGEQFSK